LTKFTAVYVRVSSRSQDLASQEGDLKRWCQDRPGEPVRWFRDKFTAKTMDRPGFARLMDRIRAGNVNRIVVWRLDRLGRTAKGLTTLFDDLTARKVDLVSLRDGLDLATPAGRRMANVLASVAAYETEVRAERIRAGQEAAWAAGKRWGGSPKGRRLKVTVEQEATIRRLKADGEGVTAIARTTGLSRPTIYRVLGSVAGAGSRPRNRPKARPRRRGVAGESAAVP
jgi:DNA invertase Pin-like site-specific DNA recombinase